MAVADRALALLAFVLAVAAIFAPWWVVQGDLEYEYGPYRVWDFEVYAFEGDQDFTTGWGPVFTGLFATAAALLLFMRVGDDPGHSPFRMPQRLLRYLGDVLLTLTSLCLVIFAWMFAAINRDTEMAVVAGVLAVLPIAAIVAWHSTPRFSGWWWMVPYLLLSFLPDDVPDDGGWVLLLGLVPFTLANLAREWPANLPRGLLGAASLLLVLAAATCFLFWPEEGFPFWGSRTTPTPDGLAFTDTGEPARGLWLSLAAAVVSALAYVVAGRPKTVDVPPGDAPSVVSSPDATGK